MSTTGLTIWLTGLSGAGKSTIAGLLAEALRARGRGVEILDGDVVRTHLSKGLGFSRQDRDTNVLRIGWVCEVLTRHDVIAIAAVISPYRATRDEVRRRIGRFVEVFVHAPLEVCIERDVKGLYKKALAGELPAFTGISGPYEPPLAPDLTIHTAQETPEQSVARILAYLEQHGWLAPASTLAVEVPA
jgi:adenylylsulfate kinase